MPHTKHNPGRSERNLEPMIPATIEALLAQRVADAIVRLETPWNIGSGGNEGENSQGDNRVPTRVCSYKDYMNCKPKPFYRNEGIVGMTR